MASKKELSWKPYHGKRKGGRWFKKIDGDCVYFGSSPNKSDAPAYRKAVSEYRKFQRQREQEEEKLDRIKNYEEIFKQTGRDPKYAAWGLAAEDNRVEREKHRQQSIIAEARRLLGEDVDGKQRPALSKLIDDYVKEQERRHVISQSNPDALPAKHRLGHAALRAIRGQMNAFKLWCEQTRSTLGSDSHATEAMLRSYRTHLDSELTSGRIKPATVSNRVRVLRRFVRWLWKHHHIEEIPRGLDEICLLYSQEKKAKIISDSDLEKLWKHSDNKMRAMIALAINCGFYWSEIAQLQGSHLRSGYIARRRPKTGVPSKHKLWTITENLIETTRTNHGADELLYLTREKKPLVHDNGTRTDSLHRPWTAVCEEANVKATPSQLRDTAATFIEGVGMKHGNPELVSQFLAHADSRTARWYIDQSINPSEIQTAVLDDAIKQMEEHFIQVFKN